jgi:predicted esterase
MPVYVCHGTNDQTIPVSQTRLLTARMAESHTFVYREIPDGHHDSPLASGFDEGFNWVLGKISSP